MADKELLQLNGGSGLSAADVASAQGLYVVDADGNSRFVSFANLKTAINTNPTVVPSSVPWRGARVSLTANQSIPNNTTTTMSWGQADEDTDSFWSAGAPTRLTIPSGVTRVRLASQIYFASSSTGIRSVSHNKGGSAFAGRGSIRTAAVNDTSLGCVSADVPVSSGNYFEVAVVQASGGALNVTQDLRTWFEITVIEATP